MPLPNGFPNLSILSAFRVAILALLVVSCLKVLQPFLGALTWAAIIAISVWPLYGKLKLRLRGRHKLAALLVVLGLSCALAIPIGLMALTLADTLPHLANLAHDLTSFRLPDPPAWLSNFPLAGESLRNLWLSTQADLPGFFDKVRPAVQKAGLWLLSGGANLGLSLLEIVLAIVVAGLLLINGDKLWDLVERIVVRLGGETAGDLPEVIARTIRSVTTGVVGTALAQTILCVVGLLIAGVPGALVLGFVCFVIAVAQMPTLIVWLPAALWVFYTGHTGLAVFLTVWGFLLINTIDNFLKPLLISQGAQMPLSVIFLGVIGGLIAWGVIGLFIGPTLLAVALTMLRHWLERDENEEMACEGEQG
ncbi:AI-2E family transporter [Chromobacterium sp. IIBBL 290-4]|uniref:AI-2E family transporter n=1 Tax=Chromobacterium sp. IIBBL 290-4 TaxID=2953890 RepID=UPI0020B89BD3|nr:AI-2E family transporter [Chromobacterium sp. IIBBL 290-4]UTH73940.1 AI-2E family transporter [Chromobacterium sp. IIBBL 290-4]